MQPLPPPETEYVYPPVKYLAPTPIPRIGGGSNEDLVYGYLRAVDAIAECNADKASIKMWSDLAEK